MNITEYAVSRGLSHQTVSIYISRHAEEFQGHIKKDGKSTFLDDTALEILDKKYPLPQPVQVVQDQETKRKLEALKDEMILLQREVQLMLKEKAENAVLIAEAEQQKKYIAQQDELLELEKQEKKALKELVQNQKEELQNLKEHFNEQRNELANLKSEQARLKSRGFFARLLNK